MKRALVLLLATLITWPQLVSAHGTAILACPGIFDATEAKLELWGPTLTGNNKVMWAERYDINGDGKWDISVLSEPLYKSGGEGMMEDIVGHNPFPLWYGISLTGKEYVDLAYIDTKGKGVCTDIVLHRDLRITPPEPTTTDKDAKHGGQM